MKYDKRLQKLENTRGAGNKIRVVIYDDTKPRPSSLPGEKVVWVELPEEGGSTKDFYWTKPGYKVNDTKI